RAACESRPTARGSLLVILDRAPRQLAFEPRVPLPRLLEGRPVVDVLPLLTLLVRHGEQPAHRRGAALVARLAAAALLVRPPALDQLGDDLQEQLDAGGPGELRVLELRQDLRRGPLGGAGHGLRRPVVHRRRGENLAREALERQLL